MKAEGSRAGGLHRGGVRVLPGRGRGGGRHRRDRVEAEALRRLAVLHHHRNERETAKDLSTRAMPSPATIGDQVLAGEALNVPARVRLRERRDGGGAGPLPGGAGAGRQPIPRSADVSSRISASSPTSGAITPRRRITTSASLEGFEASADQKGRAIAHHNLGMVSADRRLWEEADQHFRRSLEITREVGDVHLEGLCLLEPLRGARRPAALRGGPEPTPSRRSPSSTASAPGSTRPTRTRCSAWSYRETGRYTLAESRLQAAIEQAVSTGSVLSEAEASRELARLYQSTGPEPGGAPASQRRAPALLPARRAGGPGGRHLQDATGWRRPTSRWCATGASRSNRRTATPSVTASGWRATRWRSARRWARTRAS